MKHFSARVLTCLALVAPPFAHGAAAELPAAAVAEALDVPTVLHGTTVHDPYRWMEDVKSASVQQWMQAQGHVARQVLDRIEGRDALAARIKQLDDAQGDTIRSVTVHARRPLVLPQARARRDAVEIDVAPGCGRCRARAGRPTARDSAHRRAARHQLFQTLVGWQARGLRHVGRRLGRRLAVHADTWPAASTWASRCRGCTSSCCTGCPTAGHSR